MKTLLPLLFISSTAFANQYTFSASYNKITDKPFGITKEINNIPVKHSGSLFEFSLAEDKGDKFFGANIRNALNVGVLNSTIYNANFQTLAIGFDKQLYHNFGRFQLLKSLGVGYKFTSQIATESTYDKAMPSQLYARLGLELNYLISKKLSVGFSYKHFSNGGTTMPNFGYDFYGLKINVIM